MKVRSWVALVLVFAGTAAGAALARQDPVPEDISGPIERLTLDRPDDPGSDATIVVAGRRITIPAASSIQLPATNITVRDLFVQAPPGCRKRGESGIASADECRKDPAGSGMTTPTPTVDPEAAGTQIQPPGDMSAPVAKARISAMRSDAGGPPVAVSIDITKNIEEFWGGVTFVNESAGYLRVNGALRSDEGGTVLRINDPFKQLSDQRGVACGTEGNCSPDARFRLDTARLSVRFERGNPACIGGDAEACPEANRSVPSEDTLTHIPIKVGDNVRAEGAYEIADGVRFFSAQSLIVQAVLPADR